MTTLTARCADCGHIYRDHLQGGCWGRIDYADDVLGEGHPCECDRFAEYDDDWDDEDVEPCSMCGSPYCAEMCDDLPDAAPVLTRVPLARYL